MSERFDRLPLWAKARCLTCYQIVRKKPLLGWLHRCVDSETAFALWQMREQQRQMSEGPSRYPPIFLP